MRAALDAVGLRHRQELARFNTLLELASASLRELVQALHGDATMTEPARELGERARVRVFSRTVHRSADRDMLAACLIGAALLARRVPPLWARVAYPTTRSLPGFVSDLVKRVQFFQVGAPRVECSARA